MLKGPHAGNPDTFHTRTAATARNMVHAPLWRAEKQYFSLIPWHSSLQHTSWILGISNNSENTKTPGAAVASSASFAAPRPLADLERSTKGSSFAAAPTARSKAMMRIEVAVQEDGRRRSQARARR